MPEPKKSAEGSFRWWEFYAVRYAMSTIVGGVIFYVLCSGTPILTPLASHIQYLAAFGLVYCYIASAPILVFHAGRFLLERPVLPTVGLVSVVAVVVGTLIWWLIPRQQIPCAVDVLFLVAVVASVFVLCLQGLIVWCALWQGDQMWHFYKKLSDRREDANKGGVVESYRHLREHGNSFFIVLLEILLGVVLVVTSAVVGLTPTPLKPPTKIIPLDSRFVLLLLILIVWILPAVLVWLIATQFERKFADPPPQV